MKKIKETLWADYNRVSEEIKCLESKDERYELLLEERDKLRNEIFKLEQSVNDAALKKFQIESENRRDKIRNQIAIGTFIGELIFSGIMIYKTFYFDDKSTVTSTLGRAILNGSIPRRHK